MRVYTESSAIIYAIEGVPALRAAALAKMAQAERSIHGLIITSRLSRLECRVKPLREGDMALLALFDAFFTRRRLQMVDISADIIERATDLRVRYGFKTPDAIHLATAIEERADLFITGDLALARCTEIKVEVIRP